MRLEEVLPALREGKKIRRSSWSKERTLFLDDRDPTDLVETDEYFPEGIFTRVLYCFDVLANDWEVENE